MAGEKQDLVCGTELPERLECGAAAAEIEVDEYVVKDDRQRVDVVGVFADQRKPHGKIELLGGAAAQELRCKSDAVGALDLDFTAVEWSNHARIALFGHDTEQR